jgi:parallel beta-helix repeat protein
MLTLLLMGMFTMALGTVSVEASSVIIQKIDNSTIDLGAIRASRGYLTRRNDAQPVDLKDDRWASIRYWSRAVNGYIPSGSLDEQEGIDVPQSHLIPSYKWDFENPIEWRDFACVDDDSAEFIVGLTSTQPKNYVELKKLITLKGGMVVNKISTKEGIRAIVADIPFKAISSFVAEAQAADLSRYIEPNLKFQPTLVPNDPYWYEQWGPRKIEAEFAWNTTRGESTVLVAVIDSGIDYNHPDLVANYVPLGYDWVNNDTDPLDDYGHGTHCAGIIGAEFNNGIGIAGLAQVRIMAEKSGAPQWTEDNLVNGIYHAVDQGADILSCSWGDYQDSVSMREAIKYAYNAGVLVVAAAGNEETSAKLYPAAYEEVVAVTATNEFDEPASFTNFGDWGEVAAPGVNIYSTISEIHDPHVHYPYDSVSGTSMSTPHVAGVAALIWSQFPNMTRHQVRAQLQYTADDLGYSGFDVYYGYGRINAKRAVERSPLDHDLLISRLETPSYVKPGNTAVINTTVFNFGTKDESDITVQLLVNGSLASSTIIGSLANMKSATVSFPWIPTVEGIYNVTSYVVIGPSETVTENNALSICIPVRNAKIFRVPEIYSTIQAAVDATISGIGDTVKVAPGTYYEHLTIKKSVTILGENRGTTIIDGNGTGTVVYILTRTITLSRVYAVGGINFSRFTIRNGEEGIFVHKCGSDISENIISNNGYGIYLSACSVCTLRDNDMIGNRLNFHVHGHHLSHFMHDIDTSNMVDGKSVYYWVNKHDGEVPADAGYVAAVNSTNIFVRNLNLAKNGQGVLFAYTTNSTIANLNASNNEDGIFLHESRGNIISANVISENDFGISLYTHSDNNIVSNNKISNNWLGIWLPESSNNTIRGNTVSDNHEGILLEYASSNNMIYHNNFINNADQVYATRACANTWDDGYPSGGNYWSDQDHSPCADHYSGPYRNETGSDGIVDTPYTIDADNRDRYPLMGRWPPLMGDLNFDGIVNVKDIFVAAKAFGSYPGHPRWSPIADVNKDEKVNVRDLFLIAKNFGKISP